MTDTHLVRCLQPLPRLVQRPRTEDAPHLVEGAAAEEVALDLHLRRKHVAARCVTCRRSVRRTSEVAWDRAHTLPCHLAGTMRVVEPHAA